MLFSFSLRSAFRRSVFCLCVAVHGLSAAIPATDDHTYVARVSRVHDGDSVWVRPLDGRRERKLRIDGIDAPEICQEGGVPSRDALRAHVLHQVVIVYEGRPDRYKRPLVRLMHGDQDVAGWMVQKGWAWSYRSRRSAGPYAKEEAAARAQRRGIFSEPSPQEPRIFRRQHGPCPWRGSGRGVGGVVGAADAATRLTGQGDLVKAHVARVDHQQTAHQP